MTPAHAAIPPAHARRTRAPWAAAVAAALAANAALHAAEPASPPGATLVSTAAQGSDSLRVETAAPPASMSVAGRLTLRLAATASPGWTVQMPDVGPQFGEWTVASASVEARPETPERATLTLVLEPFLAGRKQVPALTVTARAGTRTLSVRTEPATVDVTPVAEPEAGPSTALEPPRTPVPVPLPDDAGERTRRLVRYWAVAGLTLAAVAFGASRLLAPRRPDPARAARACLAAAGDHLRAGRTADALATISAALRAFADARFGLPTAGRTGRELDTAVPEPRVPEPHRSELVSILQTLDTARFAPAPMAPDAAASLVERAGAVVRALSEPGPAAAPEGRA